jgi:glutamate dehydrogenase/leucine dehydrogenase
VWRPCDILVPATMEQAIDARMARRLQCRVLAEAANGPKTPDTDEVLDQRKDIFVLPDIRCNASSATLSGCRICSNSFGGRPKSTTGSIACCKGPS